MPENEKHPICELGEAIYNFLCKTNKVDSNEHSHVEIPFQIPGHKDSQGMITITHGVIRSVQETTASGIVKKYRYND